MGELSSGPSNGINLTHVEYLKDSDKVLLPSRNLVLITLREDESGDRIPFSLLIDLPLHRNQGSVNDISVSGSRGIRITGMSHAVSSPIASRTDWLSPSTCLPFNLLYSA
jgi:hypothetical protein